MDFNAIYLEFAPYINGILLLFGGGGLGTAVIKIVGKVNKTLKEVKEKSNFSEMFKNALPKEFTLKVESMAKAEFERLTKELKKEFISPLDKLIELNKSTAKAIASFKTVPDSIKSELNAKLDTDTATVESYKIELSKDFIQATEKANTYIPEAI